MSDCNTDSQAHYRVIAQVEKGQLARERLQLFEEYHIPATHLVEKGRFARWRLQQTPQQDYPNEHRVEKGHLTC